MPNPLNSCIQSAANVICNFSKKKNNSVNTSFPAVNMSLSGLNKKGRSPEQPHKIYLRDVGK